MKEISEEKIEELFIAHFKESTLEAQRELCTKMFGIYMLHAIKEWKTNRCLSFCPKCHRRCYKIEKHQDLHQCENNHLWEGRREHES